VLKVGGIKEQPCVVLGVTVSIYIVIAQGKAVGLRATVIRVKDKEVESGYLHTHLEPRVTIPFRYAAKTPSIRGPFEEDVMPNELLNCGVEECMVVVGGIDTGRKSGGGMMSEKSSWLSDDAASSASADMSTSAGRRDLDVMGVRRAYAYRPQRGVASWIHLRDSFCRTVTWAGGVPSTNRVVCSAEKVMESCDNLEKCVYLHEV